MIAGLTLSRLCSVLAFQNVGPKILAVLGKDFGGRFDNLCKNLKKISALDALLAKITNWWALLV
jgi:hypothetical protein